MSDDSDGILKVNSEALLARYAAIIYHFVGRIEQQ